MTSRDLLKLSLSRGELNDLAVAQDKARKGTTTVRVNVAALGKLIRDHGRVVSRLHECGVQTEDAPELETTP